LELYHNSHFCRSHSRPRICHLSRCLQYFLESKYFQRVKHYILNI
jgi:hypothetical protein